MWYSFWQFWSQVLFILLFDIRIYGVRNVPAHGGVILASNHQSYLDPVIVGLPLPRRISIMAREGLFRFAPFGRLIRSLGAFPVKRSSADVRAMREGLRRLEGGEQLLLFPEATRTNDGSIRPLQPGLAVLASHSKAAVVPVVIEGAFECWPRHRLLFRPGKVRVSYGRPMSYDGKGSAAAQQFVDVLRERMLDLQTELRKQLSERVGQKSAARRGAAVGVD